MEGVAFEIPKTEGVGVDQNPPSRESQSWTGRQNDGTYPAPYPHCRNLCLKKSDLIGTTASHMPREHIPNCGDKKRAQQLNGNRSLEEVKHS